LLEPLLPLVDSILYVWQLGTMAGPALTDLLLGTVSPSGKLPITFLRAVGQIPLYYNKKNTGRPNNTHNYIPFTSSYIDIDSTPLFSYGFGLSYTTFTYSNLKISRQTIKPG
jgi:beta-glucosidase